MDYYVYWNSQQVVDVLNAIAGIMNSGAYSGIVRALGVLGLMATVLAGIWKLNKVTETIGLYWMGLTIVYLGLLVPTTTVMVRDVRAGTAVPVANVPIGIGVFASELSHVGHWLTNAYETAFVPVATNDVNRFARFGFQGPQRVLDAATRAQLQAPLVTAMLHKVMTDCVVPELLEVPSKVTQLRQSNDVLALIAQPDWVNPARSTNITYSPSNDPDALLRGGVTLLGTGVACNDAVAILNGSIGAAVTDAINQYAIQLQPGRSLLTSTSTPGTLSQIGALINGATGGADAVLTGASRTAANIVKQAAAMQALEIAGMEAESTPGSTEVRMSIGIANRSSSVQYDTMRALAQEALPKLRNAVELIIIASWPIVGLLLIMAGPKMIVILQSYLVMVLWVQLWAPLYAVVNYLTISADSTPYGRAMAMFGGGTPEAMTMIAELGATSQQIGGMLALAIPPIALALAKGGEMAATNMISTVMSPVSSAAGSSASQLAQGNMNLGNTSWGNSSEYNSNAGNRSWDNTTTGQGRTGLNADGSSSATSPQRSTMTDGFGSAVSHAGTPTALRKEESNLGTNSYSVQDSARAAQRLERATQGANEAQARTSSSVRGALAKLAEFRATGQSTAEHAQHSGVGGRANSGTQFNSRGSISTGAGLTENSHSQWSGQVGADAAVGGSIGPGGGKSRAIPASGSGPLDQAKLAMTNALRELAGEPPLATLPGGAAAAPPPASGGGGGLSGRLSAGGSYNRATGDAMSLDQRAQRSEEAAKAIGSALEFLSSTSGKTGVSQSNAASKGLRADLTQARDALQANASSLRELQAATSAFEQAQQGSVSTTLQNTHAPMAAAVKGANGEPMQALRNAANGDNIPSALATQQDAKGSPGGQAAMSYAKPADGLPAGPEAIRRDTMGQMAQQYAAGAAAARGTFNSGAGEVGAAGSRAGVTPEQPDARAGAVANAARADGGIASLGTDAAAKGGAANAQAMAVRALTSPEMNLSPADRNAASAALSQLLSGPQPTTAAGMEQRATEMQALQTLAGNAPVSPKERAAAAFVVHSMIERATATGLAQSDPGAGQAVQNQTTPLIDNSGRRPQRDR